MKNIIPQSMSKEISLYNSKKRADALKDRLEEQKELKTKKDFWKSEKRLLGKKRSLYDKIIGWKDEFKKTGEFRKLFSNESEIIVYHDSWGHEKPRYEPCDGCWSKLRLDKYGNLKYSAGYKWMPTGPSFFLDNKSVSRLSHEYLTSFYRHIENGNVYRTILDELKEISE